MTVEEDAVISQCCWVQLSKKGKALRKECSVLPNKDMLAPYRDTNPGSTSICFVPVSLTISHIYVPSAAAKCCSETEETCTGNSRNTFILCQKTIYCQLKKGILTPRAGVTFCLQNCTKSQRLHKTWKQSGTYHGSVLQHACPWKPLVLAEQEEEMPSGLLATSPQEETLQVSVILCNWKNGEKPKCVQN